MFRRTVEDFTCSHCGKAVSGDGYTNHCPACLWSRHVDIEPGDRRAGCGGMMRPIRLEGAADALRIVHRCEACGFERPNRTNPKDDCEALLTVARLWTRGGESAML